MSEEKLVPKLRFSGFDDEWNKDYLKKLFDNRNERNFENLEVLSVTINDGVLKRSDLGSDRKNKDKKSMKHVLKGDLVYNPMFMWKGASGISSYEGITSADYIVLKSKKNVNQIFFSHLFQTEKSLNKFKNYSQGSLIERLRLMYPQFSDIKMAFPSYEEQEKIANFLTSVDNKIELLEKKYQSYLNFKKYLMQQIFAQKLRFKINSSYSNFKLKDIVTKFSTGLNPRKNFKLNEGGENFYVTIKNFQNGILNLDDKCDKIDDDALKLINKRSDLQKDDLIFASIGRVGEVYLIKNNPLNWNINESVFSLRPNKQFIEPKFLYYLLNSNKIQNYFESNITGSTFKSIKMKDLKNTPVTIPDSFELQNEIINCYP